MPEPRTPVIHVVAHTHWDREWYHTAEHFRQRLVALVDELLDDPPAGAASFLLDGQAVLLDDYVAVRPERAAELATLLREGRLEAGPWYVLADELIPSGEALVRNLLAGREAVRRLRGAPPPVLYCPDSFGHPAILPELARGFGCDVVLLWRGYGGARWPAGDAARWRGPSGAEVLLYHLPPDGYEFGSSLPVDASAASARWRVVRDTLLPRAATGVALLLNGADHHARQREQPAALAALAVAARPTGVEPASLRSAATALADAACDVELPMVSGELRDSYGYTWTLGGTLASRAAQKRRNALAERTLVRDVEPWIALAGYPRVSAVPALLAAAWRDLLRGHPHDTLCGTSIDAVAEALDHRVASVMAQAEGLREGALETLVRHDRERARPRPGDWRPALLLRNPVARARSGVAEITLAQKLADVAVGPGSAGRQGIAVAPDESLFARMGAQVLSRRQTVELTESPRAYPDADLVEESRVLVWVQDIGGYVAETRLHEAPVVQAPLRDVRVAVGMMENGLLRVTVGASGAVRVEELASTRAVTDAVRLEVARDAGDLYTPAIREPLPPPRFVGCHASQRGPLRGELTLRFVDAEAGGAETTLRLQLDAELAALRIAVDGVNARREARWRLRLASDLGGRTEREGADGRGSDGGRAAAGANPEFGGAPHVRPDAGVARPARAAYALATDRGIITVADAAFHPVTRTVPAVSDADAAMERVVSTAPLHRFVSRFSDAAGMTVFSDGLAEYESLDDGAVAVTLLRAVGELSRADLPERPGHAGWPASTPAAQCLGPFSAQLAVALHGGDSPAQRDAIERLADDILLPIRGATLRANLHDATVGGGLELRGEGLAFSAAMPAQREGWIVLRCLNRREQRAHGSWHLALPVGEARLARLDETPGDALPVRGGTIAFDAGPRAIVTILVRVA